MSRYASIFNQAPVNQPSEHDSVLSMLTRRGTVGLILLVLVVGNLAVYAAIRPKEAIVASTTTTHYEVGHMLVRNTSRAGNAAFVDANISLTLSGPDVELAQQRLDEHRYWVRRDISDVIRRARPSALVDPQHSELRQDLKTQLQTLIGVNAITDVSLNGFKVRNDASQVEKSDSSGKKTSLLSSASVPAPRSVPGTTVEERAQMRETSANSTAAAAPSTTAIPPTKVIQPSLPISTQ